LSAASTAKLASLLDPGLPAINPLDAWSTGGPDYHVGMQQCFATLMCDPAAAFGAVVHDRAPGGGIYGDYLEYLRAGHRASGKPAFLVSNRQGTGADSQVIAATREGFPVLDGVMPFLRGAKHLLDHRDFLARDSEAPLLPHTALAGWRARLADGRNLDENDAMILLRDFGLPANPGRIVANEAEARGAAREFGYPVVLKTAMRGIDHKSDRGGVHLGIGDEAALITSYRDLATRIDPRVLVAPMITAEGVEMLLGMIHDDQFGPVVLLGFGGLHVEALADVVHALPPFDAAEAGRLIDRLALAPLLKSRRHRRALAVDEFCRTAAQFSVLAAGLGDLLDEMDLNPLIVHADGCVIVDALVVTKARKT
jgi:hypothetical protein